MRLNACAFNKCCASNRKFRGGEDASLFEVFDTRPAPKFAACRDVGRLRLPPGDQRPNAGEIEGAFGAPAGHALRNLRAELFIQSECTRFEFLAREGFRKFAHGRARGFERVTKFGFEIPLDASWFNGTIFADRSDSVFRVDCGNGPAAELHEKFLASLAFPGFLDFRRRGFVDAQVTALGLSRETRDSLAERKRFVAVESKPLGNDSRPEREDRSAIDEDAVLAHG